MNKLDLPGEHDAEALPAAASDGLEEVLPHAGFVEEITVGVDQLGVEDLVDGEAMLAHHHADGAAAEVAAHADGRAHTGWEPDPRVVLRDGVVQLPDGRAGVNPSRGLELVEAHGAEFGEVDHPKAQTPRTVPTGTRGPRSRGRRCARGGARHASGHSARRPGRGRHRSESRCTAASP
ncbi:hypothetical protein ACQ4PT_019156 [Festuca glaucescens]